VAELLLCTTTTGIRLLRAANGSAMQNPEAFLRKVREAIGARK
jgi:hypothetical protein